MGELAEIFTSLVGILRTILEVALMTVILEGLIGIIMPMFGTALTVLVIAGIRHLLSRTKDQRVREALRIVREVALDVVAKVSQQQADAMKASGSWEGGKLSAEQRLKLRELAIEGMLRALPDYVVDSLRKQEVDIQELLIASLESAVRSQKQMGE